MEIKTITEALKGNSYPGRGILVGKSEDGKYAVSAYFIMGRSESSRNRRFEVYEEGIRTNAVDASKIVNPALVIYTAVKVRGNKLIVTNGDQTDTINTFLEDGGTFEEALRTRTFEPDPPLYTPRISSELSFEKNDFSFKLSILKSLNGDPDVAQRFFYEYEPTVGMGRLIHTYKCDGDPVPSFEGEPKVVQLKGGLEDVADEIWGALDEDNKVALFVRFINLETGEYETKIINKYE